MAEQTEDCLRRVDRLLREAGSSREHMLHATIWLADMADFDAMNEVWAAWVSPRGGPGTRLRRSQIGERRSESRNYRDRCLGGLKSERNLLLMPVVSMKRLY